MKVSLRVTVDGFLGNYSACCNIDDLYRYEFEPLHITDDPTLALATGDTLIDSRECQKRLKMRKDAADYLANQLSKMIVDAMSADDTLNGYKKTNKTGI